MLELHKSNTAKIGSKALQENPNLVARGVFIEQEKLEYCREYDQIIQQAMLR